MPLLALGAIACGRTDFFPDPRAVVPPRAVCGNGLLEPGEACEDGNTADDDGCRADCTPAVCGDGVIFMGAELCDDGNTVGGDGCEPDCALPFCGDSAVQPPEEVCDDGNTDNGDSCLTSCLFPFCGDGFVRRGVEACDDANALTNDACIGCVAARCGDGFVWRGVEACDDGNLDPLDACSNTCTLPVCGDGVVSQGEACDLGLRNEDRPGLVVNHRGTSRAVQPLLGLRDAAGHYDYRSASSHTGLERAEEGRLYVYLDRPRGQLFLVLNYGLDDASQSQAEVEVELSGVPAQAQVVVADDRAEELAQSGPGTFRGSFDFDGNTDGGVIGPLPYPGDWRIVIVHTAMSGLGDLVFLDHGRDRLVLSWDAPIALESLSTPSMCGTDCRVPRCGDGDLDGGEVCDSPEALCGPTCS